MMVAFEQHAPDDSILDRLRQSARARVEREQAEALSLTKHFAFCRWMIAHGRLTDYPIDEITPTFYRVTRQPKVEDESWER